MRDKTNNEKGIAMIMVVIAMVVIIGFAALAVDFGNAATRKSRLQNACDAAALAGAQALTDIDEAADIAENIFKKNIKSNINNAEIWVPEISFPDVGTVKNHKIRVSSNEEFETILLRILGKSKMTVSAYAAAVNGPIGGASGLRPFGIDIHTWENYELYADDESHEITLEYGPGDGDQGNYALMDLDGEGKTGVKIAIENGSKNTYSEGEIIYTETGVAVGPISTAVGEITDETSDYYPTYSNDEYDGYIICPIVQPINADGEDILWQDMDGKSPTRIVGFAVIEVCEYNISDKTVTGKIINKYDDVIVYGEVDLTARDFGLNGINLTE